MKKNKDYGNLIAKTIMLLTGAGCGIFIITTLNFFGTLVKGPMYFVLMIIVSLALMYASFFVQAIFHEGGHLIFGLATGYKFVSFRIGHIMLVKEKGRLKVRLFNIVGTGGQCLLMPPQWSENMPYRLYNLGGCIANAATAILSLAIYFFIGKEGFFALFMAMLFVSGLSMALTNGLPLKVGGIATDGHNALSLKQNSSALRALWLQLYVNGLVSRGERYHNMPREWFCLPEGEDLSDPICCTVGVMLYNYYFDSHMFGEAEKTIEYMIDAPGILGVQKNELLCELLFLKVLRNAPSDEINSLLTPQLNRYIKATANYVSRRRLAYAYQLLYLKNISMAQKCLEVFEHTANLYPYSAETEGEREIIEIIKQRSTIY